MATTTKRQTAGNNASLRAIRAWMNGPIYKGALELMNEKGPEAVAAYLGQFFRAECRAERVAAIMTGEMPGKGAGR